MNKPRAKFIAGPVTSNSFFKEQHVVRHSLKQKSNEETQKRIAEYIENLTSIEEDEFATANAMQRHTLLNIFLHEKFKYPEKYIGETSVLFDQFKFLDNIKRYEVLKTLDQKICESRFQNV